MAIDYVCIIFVNIFTLFEGILFGPVAFVESIVLKILFTCSTIALSILNSFFTGKVFLRLVYFDGFYIFQPFVLLLTNYFWNQDYFQLHWKFTRGCFYYVNSKSNLFFFFAVNFCSCSTTLPLVSTEMFSLWKNLFDVRTGLTVFQNFLISVNSSAVGPSNQTFLGFLFNKLLMFNSLLYWSERFHDDQSNYLFCLRSKIDIRETSTAVSGGSFERFFCV